MKSLPLILFYLPVFLGQLTVPLLISAGAGCLLRHKFGWRRVFLITLAVLILLIGGNLLHPPIVCPGDFQPYLTRELREGIYEFFPGWRDFPVIPLCYRVTDARDGYLEVTKHFLYGGRMRFTVSLDDSGIVVPEKWD